MTVRTLVLLRHAKAEPPDDHPTDHERPLAKRGHLDAVAAGRWLVEQGHVPDAVLCSTALRTRETWQEVASVVGDAQVGYLDELYHGGAGDLLNLARAVPSTVRTLLVVGHNPTVSTASDLLDQDALEDGGLRTSGLAVHRFDGEWSALVDGARLVAEHTARG